ncbi:regulator of G-protein signaling 3 [Ixodes scapularis]
MARPRKMRSPSEERAWQARRAEQSRLRAAAAREQRRAQDPDYHAREAARMRRRRQDRQVREEETKRQCQRRAEGDESWEHEADAKRRGRRDLPDVVPSTVVTAECQRASLDIPSGCVDDPVPGTASSPVPHQASYQAARPSQAKPLS